MSGHSESSMPESPVRKQDDKQKRSSSNPSGSCQNHSPPCLFQRRGSVAGEITNALPVTDEDSSNFNESSTDRSSSDDIQDLFQHASRNVKSASAGGDNAVSTPTEIQRSSQDNPNRYDTSSTETEKSLFGRKQNEWDNKKKLSNTKDVASQTSPNHKETDDPQSHYRRRNDPSSVQGSSGPVPTPQSSVSSATGEQSSENNTGTWQLQLETISEGDKSSPSEHFRAKLNK